jgi:anti-sigma regulatory factor (Ser/Thr protein kinase)/predicted transcriptional regulator
MKFQEGKKTAIVQYILEKISQGESRLTKTVSETFEINQNTVHSYVNELVQDNVIRRVKRGHYELVSQEYEYHLQRSRGELDTDITAYRQYLLPLLTDYAQSVRDIWAYTLSEMFNNAIDHSQAENVTIHISADYMKTTVYLMDDGVGIFEKIKDFFGFQDLDEAISELFKGKLTTDAKNHSGEGIFFSSKVMDDFAIVSSGKVFSCNKYDASSLTDASFNPAKGTCVIMSLSNYSNKDIKEVFDQYADIDFGFMRTKIPVKNMVDSVPVSRSQAKRVSFRLEKFKEAEIDFSEIDWMGQGFAHQLFVVFQNEHPELKLIPSNMNESVEKMYRHVLYEK